MTDAAENRPALPTRPSLPSLEVRPTLAGARDVFAIAVERMLPRLRSLWVLLLLGIPVFVGLYLRVRPPERAFLSGLDLYALAVSLFYVRNLLPLVALLFGTALVSDAADTKTLTYYFTRPVSRFSVFLGEYAAYVATAFTVALPCVVLTFVVFCAGTPSFAAGASNLVRDLGACALTLVAYGAVFALMGVVFRRPLIPGLVYLFGWESMANLPGDLPNYTLSAYARSLMSYRPQEEGLAELFAKYFSAGESVLVLAVAAFVALLLASWIFSRREYVL